MRLAVLHARAGLVELLRIPAYVIPTVGFPTMFFLFFAAPGAGFDANVLMALFAGFAVLGVAFFQFGVGIASERSTPWERYLRTLAIEPASRFGGRVLAALAVGAASACVVVVAALLTTPAGLPAARWLELAAVLGLGSIPFALLGIALGYLAPVRAALPIANVAYLSLSYLGGLWTKPDNLPGVVQRVSVALPTRALADSLAGVAVGIGVPWRAVGILVAYGVAFGVLAGWAYRRDEGERYR